MKQILMRSLEEIQPQGYMHKPQRCWEQHFFVLRLSVCLLLGQSSFQLRGHLQVFKSVSSSLEMGVLDGGWGHRKKPGFLRWLQADLFLLLLQAKRERFSQPPLLSSNLEQSDNECAQNCRKAQSTQDFCYYCMEKRPCRRVP